MISTNSSEGGAAGSVPTDAPRGAQLEAMHYTVAGWSGQPPGTPVDEWECEQVWFVLTVPGPGGGAQIRFRIKSKRAYDEFMESFRQAGGGRWKGEPAPGSPGPGGPADRAGA